MSVCVVDPINAENAKVYFSSELVKKKSVTSFPNYTGSTKWNGDSGQQRHHPSEARLSSRRVHKGESYKRDCQYFSADVLNASFKWSLQLYEVTLRFVLSWLRTVGQ